MNQHYDFYRATINGYTFAREFRFHELKRISETFKNVTWKLIPQEVSK